jgi:Uma2 family endonuclease
MAVEKQRTTMEEFIEFVYRPENADRIFELIDGRVVEKGELTHGEIVEKMPGTTRNSAIAAWIIFFVRLFCREREIPCFITGEQGTYNILGRAYAPDFAFKQTPTSAEYPDPIPPLWVVEVISPNDKPHEIRAKRQVYLQAGILYWELYPEDQSVDVYTPNQPMRTYRVGDVVGVGEVIPGFTLAIADLFE